MIELEPDTIRTLIVFWPELHGVSNSLLTKGKNLIGWPMGISIEAPNRTRPDIGLHLSTSARLPMPGNNRGILGSSS